MIRWMRSRIGVKLLITFSLVLMLSMVSMIYVATRLVAQFGEFSASKNEANIRDNVKVFLARITHEQAMRYDSTFKKFSSSSSLLAKQSAFFLNNTTLYGKAPFNPNEKLTIYPHNRIFSNDASQATMVLYWGSPVISQGISEQINVLSRLDPLLEAVKKGNPESVACYTVTESAIARYYPNIHGVEKLPPTTEFDIRNANWYVISRPENNPERKTAWSNIYLDSVGQGLMTTASTPIYSKTGEFLGATGVDVTLDTIVNDILGNIPSCHKMEHMFSFLTDDQARIIAFPPEYLETFELKIDRDKLVDATVVLKYSLLDSSNAETRKIGQLMIEKDYQVSSFSLKGRSYMVSFHFMPSTGWRLGVVIPESVILASVQETRVALDSTVEEMTTKFTLVTLLFLIGAIIVMVIFSIKYFIRPLDDLSRGALRVKEGDLTKHVEIHRKDEIGSLGNSFNSMVDALRKGKELEKGYARDLEQKVKEKTEQIKTRNDELKNALQGLRQEVADRRKAEDALRESEFKFRSLFDLSPQAVAVTDIKMGKFVAVNDKFCELTKFNREELLGKTTIEAGFFSEESRKKFLSELEGPEEIHGLELDFKAKDGSVLNTLVFSRLIRLAGESLILTICVDVTERNQLEAQLQQSRKIEAIGTLAGGIAHDFNNLLMGIQGNASLMFLDIDANHPHYEKLKSIEQYVQNGADLTKQLLGFARGGKYEVRPTDLNELIKRSSWMFGRTKKEITIHTEYQKDIWTVETDQGQIEQVLLNLYVNAWQAMPGGGNLNLKTENTTIDESYSRPYEVDPGRYVKISVTDTGAGMDEATRQRIFDPFFTTKDMGRGAGLGLASAYGIIKNHGGFIKVDSEKGKGTTFNIYLPASGKHLIEEIAAPKDVLKGSETVLLVDDEDMIIDVGTHMMNSFGYEVLVAGGGKEALEIYNMNREKIDLVILDMIMPGMGGGEVYDRLKEINPDIKVLLSSGYSIDGQASEILERGCNGFIQKPFNMKALSHKLREILDKK